MKLGIIGDGAIAGFVREQAVQRGWEISALLLRAERLARQSAAAADGILRVASVAELPQNLDIAVDCAGHTALRAYGAELLRGGTSLVTLSLGALADDALHQSLQEAAAEGQSTLHLASGAIGALDCLRAARVGGLHSVRYIGRKPPQGWKGSPAEALLDLDNPGGEACIHFAGSAREAAITYPKNANVAAAIALAGIGFDDTRVQLIADPGVTENIHELHASGEFGSLAFEIRGQALPGNPRSSALAAMSVVSTLEYIARDLSPPPLKHCEL